MKFSLAIAITNRCPLKCSFCCVPPGPGDLSEESLNKIYSETIKKRLFSNIGFTGGEPLLCKDKIIKYGRLYFNNNIFWGMTTGLGTIKNEKEAVETAMELIDAKIDHITVSVDETHLKNKSPKLYEDFINTFISNKKKVIVSVTRYNDEFKNPLPIKINTNSEYLSIEYHYVSKAGFAKNTKRVNQKFTLSNGFCPMKSGMPISIWPDGEIYPCCAPSIVNKNKELSLGNFFNDISLEEIIIKLKQDLYLNTIKHFGFAGLINVSNEVLDWEEIFDSKIIDACHLCSLITKKKGIINAIKKNIKELAVSK